MHHTTVLRLRGIFRGCLRRGVTSAPTVRSDLHAFLPALCTFPTQLYHTTAIIRGGASHTSTPPAGVTGKTEKNGSPEAASTSDESTSTTTVTGGSAEDFRLNAAPWINQRQHNAMFNVEQSSSLQRYWALCGLPLVFLFTCWGIWWWWAYTKWSKPVEEGKKKKVGA